MVWKAEVEGSHSAWLPCGLGLVTLSSLSWNSKRGGVVLQGISEGLGLAQGP